MAQKFTEAQIKAALRQHHGAIHLAAEALGASRQALHQRVKRSKELQGYILEIEESLLDHAECGLAKAVDAIEPWAIRFVLITKGRDRGYGRSRRTETIRIPDAEMEQLICAVGGDVEIYRRRRNGAQ